MVEIEELACPNCGAPIDKYTERCEFCGTYLIIESDNYQIPAFSGVGSMSSSTVRYERPTAEQAAYALYRIVR